MTQFEKEELQSKIIAVLMVPGLMICGFILFSIIGGLLQIFVPSDGPHYIDCELVDCELMMEQEQAEYDNYYDSYY